MNIFDWIHKALSPDTFPEISKTEQEAGVRPINPYTPKTQYRIVYPDRHICRLEYASNGEWYSIPPDDICHLDRVWQNGVECLYTVHSYNNESQLRSFVNEWPQIEKYFERMRAKQKEWNDENGRVDRSVKYLQG